MRIQKRKFIQAILILASFCAFLWVYQWSRHTEVTVLNSLLLSAIVAVCVIKGIKEKYLINPFFLFLLCPVSLLLYDISVSTRYLVPLKRETYFLAIWNFFLFILGLCTGKKVNFKYSTIWAGLDNKSVKNECRFATTITLIGLIPTFYGMIAGLPYLLTFNLRALKEIINSFPLVYLFNLFSYVGLCCAIKTKKANTIIINVLLLLIAVMLNFSKTTVVMACLPIVVLCYDAARVNKKMKKIFVIVLLCTMVFGYFSFDIYNSIRNDFDIIEHFKNNNAIGNISVSLFLPLMYLITPWSNLQFIVDTTSSYTYGLWMLRPLITTLQLDFLVGDAYELIPRFVAFNTYSYISVFYRDFGFFGSGVCSFFLALFIMYVYKMKLKFLDSPYVSTVFALNMYATSMLFFNNHFQQQNYPYMILVVTWIVLMLNRIKFVGGRAIKSVK